jgi:hypothetical protein
MMTVSICSFVEHWAIVLADPVSDTFHELSGIKTSL